MQLSLTMALASSKLNIIVVLVFCVSHAQAVCTCEKTPPTGNCVCQSDNSNPAQCKVCLCDHITTYVKGPPVCYCRPGYAVSSRDRKQCVDIDECNGPEGNPCQQICTNTVGSFSCSCSPGYAISSTNPNTCDDIDECNGPEGNPCQQICTNTVGSFSCSCRPGYAISSTNPNTCEDIDECNGPEGNPCQQICTNTVGSFSCSCSPGYAISSTNPNTCDVKTVATDTSKFYMVENSSLTMLQLKSDVPVINLLGCARLCVDSPQHCYSFIYHTVSRLCTTGTWLIASTNTSARNDGVLYSNGAYCNRELGFQVISQGLTTVCVWLSSDRLRYIAARDMCKAKGAHLYTPKTQEKLDIFLDIALSKSIAIWIGLNDLATVFEFVWEDDGTVMQKSWWSVLFHAGDPNNSGGNERCVCYYPNYAPAVDLNCNYQALYLCEITPSLTVV